MNIFLLIILLSFEDDTPVLSSKPRADRRFARNKAINHNRRVYHDVIGPGKWYETPDEEGFYNRGPSWKPSIKTNKSQRGRWETEKLSGHRRYEKWSKDYYSSKPDAMSKLRFDGALKEYLEEQA